MEHDSEIHAFLAVEKCEIFVANVSNDVDVEINVRLV